jgi:toxin ParE1/3/4
MGRCAGRALPRPVRPRLRPLAAAPELGQRCDDIKPGWRHLPHGTHVVFYRVVPEAQTVDIIRVMHARMDPTLHVLDDVDD